MRKRNKKIVVLLVLLLSSFCGYNQSFEPKKGSLSVLNSMFHQDYNKLVEFKISQFGDSVHPVMVLTGDSLLFFYNRKRSAARVVPLTYHLLKAVSHIPLGIFTLVSPWKEGKLDDSTQFRINQYATLLIALEEELKKEAFTSSQLRMQQEIISSSKKYLSKLQKEKVYKIKNKTDYIRSIQQYLVEDVDEAAKLEIMMLHAQVQEWRKQMDTISFQKLYVVIGSSHQARYRELSVQYFDKILKEQSDGSALSENRLVFAESVFNEAGCLSMLARH
ncbi:MAG TPA: hypothetical protein VK766_06555, partial [Cytophagaceae bacterium]|nr:hypothetical protein [Cytophagaceae bacterium]